MATPYATPEDVQDRWRLLSDDEYARALVLCNDASIRVRSRWKDIDARVLAGLVDPEAVTMVVAEMVKTALINVNTEGVSQETDTGGPFSKSRTYTNPNGNLYFTPDMIALLSGGRRHRSVKLRRTH